MNELLEAWENGNAGFRLQINIQKRRQRFLLAARLGGFSLTAGFFAYYFQTKPGVAWPILGTGVIFFLILLRVDERISRKTAYLRSRISINETEIQLAQYQFEKRDEGKDFMKIHHPYCHDLDIYGKRSVFQLLNRTTSHTGRARLASWLAMPMEKAAEIRERQEAVRELCGMPEWCQDYLARGISYSGRKGQKESFEHWLKEKDLFSSTVTGFLVIALPLLSLCTIILYATGYILSGPVWLCSLLQAGVILWKQRSINLAHDQLSRKFDASEKYASLLNLVEGANFHSEQLLAWKHSLTSGNTKSSDSLRKLLRLVHFLDARKNLILAVVLNGVLLWDIQILRRMEVWRRNHRADFLRWIDTLANLDACISLGCYAHAHPSDTFPQSVEGNFLLSSQGLGHPLIEPDKRICNNYEAFGKPHLDLLTGANMAGKSTFLRTLGVNLCLAMAGAPVCAESFRFTPMMLFTSLRTNDSLSENESFFYAELKRLQMLIRYCERGQNVFFLLDEILKGTNSTDQHNGSVALCKKLLTLEATGIIATHDVALSSLSEEFAARVRNLCFEITISNDKLNFDYRLREGVCSTMNASFLMKQMGITD